MNTVPEISKQRSAVQSVPPGPADTENVDDGAANVVQPKLAERLTQMLDERLATGSLLTGTEGGWGLTKLRVDAHREVFDSFIYSLKTYRPLLQQIQTHYNAAVADALTAAYDNMHMKEQLSMAGHDATAAVAAAHEECKAEASATREGAAAKLAHAQASLREVEASKREIEQDLRRIAVQISACQRETAEIQKSNMQLRGALVNNSSWRYLQGDTTN